MNEEIEYAEMLEIPVSTVNVIKKKRARKRKVEKTQPSVLPAQAVAPNLKESVIAQVNDKMQQDPIAEPANAESEIIAEAALFAESANSNGELNFGEIPERIDTVRL